jgi:ATP-dependent DNA helicase RecG
VIVALCAFANQDGGRVLIGVDDSGKVIGIECGSEAVQDWINQVKLATSPSVIPNIEQVTCNKRNVVVLSVGEFPVKPVSCRDRYFKRVANSNHRLNLTEITNLHLQSLQLSWDSYVDTSAEMSDLDSGKVRSFLKRVNKGGRFAVKGSWQAVLEKLGYLKDGHPTHAAILLFGKSDPPYALHIGRFKTASMIIDDRMIRGTLFEVVEEAIKVIVNHIKFAFEITGSPQRREIPEYPLAALRELLLNSVVHRDYTSPIDIQIKIFDNAITLFNPGALFGDLTVEQLRGDDYHSRTRNKLIAEAFYLTGDIEKYGSGFIRVRDEIKTYPTMKFDYEESGDGFLVSLRYQEQKISSIPVSSEGINEGINEGISEGVNEGVNELLESIRNDPGRRVPQLSDSLGIPTKTIERWIANLKRQGSIEYRGSKRSGGYYAIIKGT